MGRPTRDGPEFTGRANLSGIKTFLTKSIDFDKGAYEKNRASNYTALAYPGTEH